MLIDRPIEISLYDPPRSATKQPTTLQTTVAGLIESLTGPPDPVANKGDAAAWSPFTYRDNHRKSENAIGACALVYDLDDGYNGLASRLDDLGWVYVIHHTYTDGCARLVIPLATDCPPEAYAALWRDVCTQLDLTPDEACKDLARLYYAPSCPLSAQVPHALTGGSVLLDPVIAREINHIFYGPQDAELKPTTWELTTTPAPQPFDMTALIEEVENSSSPHRDNTLALLDGTLRLPPGTRNATMHALCTSIAFRRNRPTPEVMEALVRRVLSLRDGHETKLEEWVNEAMLSFSRGEVRKEEEDSKNAVVAAALTGKGTPDESWKTALIYTTDREGNEKSLKALEHNFVNVLRNDSAFKGHIRWNVMTNEVEFLGGVLKGFPVDCPEVGLAAWFQSSNYKCLGAKPPTMASCMMAVAFENEYNPVLEYVKELPKWDGKRRAADLLLRHAEAKGSIEWVSLVTKKFLISAMARVLRPGCQVDTTLILSGPQGVGKTSFVRTLAKGFHVETALDISSKDGVMLVARNWLVELGELASMRRSDIYTLRNFLTRVEDQVRLPYGRKVKTLVRRCAFIGTTNNTKPLADPDGNRRFWVVSVGRFNSKAIASEVDQIWAEAKHCLEAGETWWLSPDEAKRAELEAKPYEEDNEYANTLLAWLEGAPANRPKLMDAQKVKDVVLMCQPGDMHHSSRDICAAMRFLGWKSEKKCVGGRVTTFFHVPSKEEVDKARLTQSMVEEEEAN